MYVMTVISPEANAIKLHILQSRFIPYAACFTFTPIPIPITWINTIIMHQQFRSSA